jgi:outer membrane protein
MRLIPFLFACLFSLGWMGHLSAQSLKIGYANIEAILVRMPETQKMNQDIQVYEKKLVEDLQSRQQYLQTIYAEYQEMVAPYQQGGQPPESEAAAIQKKEEEIVDLEKTIREKQNEAQQKIMARRQEKMQPIVQKIQAQIDEIAAAENYDYIFNTVDGSGVSILLHGPKDHDLTMRLMKRLGIEVPEDMEAGIETEAMPTEGTGN